MKAAAGLVGAGLAAAAALAAVLAAADARERRARTEAKPVAPVSGAFDPSQPLPIAPVAIVSGPATSEERLKADLLAAELLDADAAKAEIVATQISSVHAEAALAALRAVWDRVTNSEARLAFLQAIEARAHPRRVDFWHLGMTDREAALRRRSAEVLGTYSFRDFLADRDGYADWRARLGGLPADDVRRASAAMFVASLSAAQPGTLVAMLDLLHRFATPDGLASLEKASLPGLLGVFLLHDDLAVVRAALRALTLFPRDVQLLNRIAGDMFKRDPSLAEPLLRLLASPGLGWAMPLITPMLVSEDDAVARAAAEALETIAGKSAIAELAKAILGDLSGRVAGLSGPSIERLAGLPAGESRDYPWWSSWWQANQEEWDPSIRKARTIR